MSAQPPHIEESLPAPVAPAVPPQESTAVRRPDRPYPDLPPGPLALRARHWANTIRDLGGAADEVTTVLSRNRWLWVPIWFGACLIVAACWTVVTPDVVAARFLAPAPAWIETAVSTFWGRFTVTAAVSIPVVTTTRLLRWLAPARSRGTRMCSDCSALAALPTISQDRQ